MKLLLVFLVVFGIVFMLFFLFKMRLKKSVPRCPVCNDLMENSKDHICYECRNKKSETKQKKISE